MIVIKQYTEENSLVWNQFNKNSKNPLFMFDRNYMDYHKDRFQDHSLMFYDDDKLVALLPMSIRDNKLISHGGLTYGGFIKNTNVKQHTIIECLDKLVIHAKECGISNIIFKNIPHIYHEQPSEEDIYALFLRGANVAKIEPATVINLHQPLKMPKGRKAQISRAKREGVVIKELTEDIDFYAFIDLENKVLNERHDAVAVHTGAELALLHNRFPENIHLYAALLNDELSAGTIVYEYGQVVHTQYMAASDQARAIGALDLVIAEVIERFRSTKLWLDFGISTENNGMYLNEGLISQKEGFGGRTNVYETWEITL